ncbi:MAG: N-acetylmuramoyl-L-alanine amidase [Endomicrobiia bacterium]|nr:N-acetylmuramoyl-L-alanine amidase [Endomicrobiia bacterium]
MNTSKSTKFFAAIAALAFAVSAAHAGGLTGKKIALDAGHGGTDPGAVGPTGLKEAHVTLSVVKKFDEYLRGQGAATKLTRDTDIYITPSGRGTIANNWGANSFVSVHFNAVADRTVNGTETLYHPTRNADSKKLAEKLQGRLIEALGLRNRGIKERTDLGLLNTALMPTALTESSFISNTYEEARLKDSVYTDKIARAHFLGVMDNYGAVVGGDPVTPPPPPPPPSSGKPLSGKKIVIDAAGGGGTSGGLGPTGLKGKDVNLRVATVLKNCLKEYGGADAVMTRDGDVSMTLTARVAAINASGAGKFIGVQFPRSTNPETNYTKTYYYKYGPRSAESLKLAQGIQKRLVETLKITDKGVGTSSAGILLNTSSIPGVVTKPSHLSNPYEEARLRDAGYTWKIGKAIYEGIADSYK